MPSSRTFACAASDSASDIQRSNKEFSKSLEHFMSNAIVQIAVPSGESFDEVVLPYLKDAHRLARWLMRNEHDAEDVVQEATLKAFRYFRTFSGGNGRAWFLRIV